MNFNQSPFLFIELGGLPPPETILLLPDSVSCLSLGHGRI